MQTRSSKKRPRDPNQLAASIVEEATQETPVEEEVEPQEPKDETGSKNPAAVSLGRLGGKKGG
jgi:hypothetical protein